MSPFCNSEQIVSALRNKEKVVEKLYCNVCRKSFSSQKTLDQHLKSKLHEKKMAEAQEKQEKEKQEEIEKSNSSSELKEETADETDKKEDKMESGAFSPEEYEFIPEKCLFCREISDTMEECFFNTPIIPSNLTHMFQKHGLIIPDRDSVIDMEGLLDYLGQKVSILFSLDCRSL